jgi:PKD repeat protein
MKSNYKINMYLLYIAFLLSGSFFSQNNSVSVVKSDQSPLNVNIDPMSIAPLANDLFKNNEANLSKLAIATCTDKVNYVGTNVQGSFKIGGSNGFNGVYQVFPSYKGTVIGVEFDASKYPGSDPTMSVMILNPNSAGFPGSTVAGPAAAVTLTSTAITTYTVYFPSPITITNNYGFSVAFFNYQTSLDSARFYRGPTQSSGGPYYSFITIPTTNTYTSVYNYFGFDIDFHFRPIISTSVNPTFAATKTSTGCGAPAIYSFTNTSAATSTYVNHPVINPMGTTNSLDFGDGSPVNSFASNPVSHTYGALGSYTAQFTNTYNGWTNNCSETKSLTVVVDSPVPAFSYTITGLTVTLLNTSASTLTGFVWNFGDLNSSTQAQPGTHNYTTPGTYVIELEAMAPCGKVKHSVTITVPSNSTGIERAHLSNGFSVYPNPATGSFWIMNSENKPLDSEIEIFNTIGQRVMLINDERTRNANIEINISRLHKGIYFVKLHTAGGELVKTIVKE